MELIGIVFVTLVAGVTAANPTPCCLTNKFSAVMFQIGGTMVKGQTDPVMIDDYVYLNYDYDNGMTSVESHALNMTTHQRQKVNMFNDYNTHKQYFVTEAGNCYFKTLTRSLDRPCIPGNYSYAASFQLGSRSKSLLTDTFIGMDGEKTSIYTVTSDDCTPISQNSYGNTPDGNFEMISYTYADVKHNYNTVGAFSVPTACNNAVDISGNRKRDLDEMYVAALMPVFQ